MRVGLLAHSARGDNRVCREIAAKIGYFRDRGADTRLIVANDAEFSCRIRANTQRYSRQLPDRLVPWLAKCDLVLVEPSEPAPVFDLVPQLAGGKRKIIFTDHGDVESREWAWFADAAVVHSPAQRHGFLTETGYPADRIEVLHHPVDLSFFQPGRAEKSLRAGLGIDSHSRLLLMVGQLTPKRRGPLVIDALGRLPASVHLVFVGECGGPCEPERQRCRERAARNRVADRIHFLGAVDDRALRDAYRDADLFISATDGIASLEARACGLPVIEPRRAGDNATDLATEIRRILNSAEEIEMRRKAGLRDAAGFSLMSWREQFGQLIDRILESPTNAHTAGTRIDREHDLGGPNRHWRSDYHAPGAGNAVSAAASDAA
jgi:glycosyltransferase involved in cell wall biosynthesis